MKSKALLTVLTILTTMAAMAQPCTDEALLSIPGKWKGPGRGYVENVSADDLSKENAVLAEIHKMVSGKYTPFGLNVSYGYVFGYNKYTGKNWKADPYEYSIYFLDYLCDHEDNDIKKMRVSSETGTSAYISINKIWRGGFDIRPADYPDDKQEPFAAVDRWPEKKDNYWVWMLRDSGYGRKSIKHYQYLITYDGKLPFRGFTKKEYLEYKIPVMKKELAAREKNLKDIDPNFDRASKDGFASETEIIEAMKKLIRQTEGLLTSMSREELAETAVVTNDGFGDFSGFKKEGDEFSSVLIVPDLTYYKSLPKWVPQFFCIDIRMNTDLPVFRKAIPDFERSFDFAWFRRMLGSTTIITVKGGAAPSNTSAPAAPQSVQMTTGTGKKATVKYDIYKNKPSPDFKQTPASQLRAVATKPLVNAQHKAAAMSKTITNGNKKDYLEKLLKDVEDKLTANQKQVAQELLDSAKGNMEALGNTGVFLYLKGALNEGLWCLTYAAAKSPSNDNIVNNLTGVLINVGAAPRALPLARYLASKYPKNTTVMNNLGQAWYALDELMKSKQVLDTVMLYAVYHPEANATRAAIADREGKQEEAANFINKSLRGAYNPDVEEFARKKGMKIDYANTLYRRRPFPGEYINPLDFQPPPQCTNVKFAADLEAQWKAWSLQVSKATQMINAQLDAASANYTKMTENTVRNKTVPGIPTGSFSRKANHNYKVFLDELAKLSGEAGIYLDGPFKNQEFSIDSAHEEAFKKLLEKHQAGEGVGFNNEAYCRDLDAINNTYLERMAALHNDFNDRFSEPMRSLHIELMYWSQFISEPEELRAMKYYNHALFAVAPLQAHSKFAYPCNKTETKTASKEPFDIPEPYCPISFKFKVTVVKLTGDCSKFELELNLAKVLLIGIERDFRSRKTTIAFGAGADVEIGGFAKEGDKVGFVEDAIPQLIEFAGAGAGGKVQAFVEFGSDGDVSDIGIRAEGSIEGAWTEKGDLKIGGKLGVNSGVQITGSDVAQPLVQYLNENISN